MLDKIRLKNFQCHEKMEIELADAVTTIVGSSDRGKSAILRALRWLSRNVPQGEEFIQEGKKGTTVQVIIDGQKITRRRGSGTNTYLLGENEFKAFGNSVPDTIQDILNLTDLNFQSQHDAPYWFSLSAGEVSRQINGIVDLGVIDTALSNITKKVRLFQQTLQIISDRLEKAKSKRDELDWVVDAERAYKRVEFLAGDVKLRNADLAAIKRTVVDATETLERRHNARQRAETLRNLVAVANKARSAQELIREISRTLNGIEEAERTLSEGRPNFKSIEMAREAYDEKVERVSRLFGLLDDVNAARVRVAKLQEFSLSCVDELNEATEGVCPICGGDLDEDHEDEEKIRAQRDQEAHQEAAQ